MLFMHWCHMKDPTGGIGVKHTHWLGIRNVEKMFPVCTCVRPLDLSE